MNFLMILLGLFGIGALAGGSSGRSTTVVSEPGSVGFPSEPEETPVAETPVEETPVAETPVEETPSEDAPEDETPVEETPVVETPPEEMPVAETPSEETPVEETPVAETPVTETPVAETPTEETPTEETPVAETPAEETPGEDTPNSSGGETPPVIANGTVDVIAGRVATLTPAESDLVDVRIVSNLAHGNATVNSDNTIALVLTGEDFTGAQSLTYEATHADGSVTQHQVGLNVVPGPQAGGWDTSVNHYMLETDDDGNILVETGDNHVKVHISGADSALSLADIAAIEGISVGDVTGAFLAASGTYGQSEGLALAEDAGMALWREVSPSGSETSNHLLLERGYEYSGLGRLIESGANGESPLHPLFLGAYGTGDKPVVTERFMHWQDASNNLVVQGIRFNAGISFEQNGENIIFDDVTVTGDGLVMVNLEGVTVRNSEMIDIHREDPVNDTWVSFYDRIHGMYANNNTGLLLEGNFFDMNGWEQGYDFSGDPNGPQPASIFSHNMYLDANNSDLTLVDNISMRGASFGAQVRSGGFFEDNVFIDNNAAFQINGGDYNGAGPVGSYSLANSNIITSGAHKPMDVPGALTLGLADDARMTTLVDNIVTHLADPDNMQEFLERVWANEALRSVDPYYDDTIIYNWVGSRFLETGFRLPDQNVEGLDTNVLDETTIQNFAAEITNNPDAAIEDLSQFIRQYLDGAMDERANADAIVDYFQDGFGVSGASRTAAETVRFEPSDLGEGVRWDNRLNWDTQDLPGTVAGDSVDLGGNHVVYGGNHEIDTLDFGPGGWLDFHHGRLDVTGGLISNSTGEVTIQNAGQLWADGSNGSGSLDISVNGGRFANTGEMENTSLSATDGQSILATGGAEFDLTAGERLELRAEDARMGFDGDDGGIAILDLHDDSTLAFAAEDGDFGSIAEFRSGAFGDAPDVQSGIDLGGATLEIDLTGLDASAGSVFTLMDSDELVGLFESASVTGLGGRDATIVIDYANDSVRLELNGGGSGQVSILTEGDMADVTSGEEALWTALTSDQDAMSETLSTMAMVDEDAAEEEGMMFVA